MIVGRTYRVLYRNYKGEVRWREVKILGMTFKISNFHSSKPSLYLSVLDKERQVVRDFNPSDVLDTQLITNRWKRFWETANN